MIKNLKIKNKGKRVMMDCKKVKKEKAITLIALVITIIVLLILAGVTIAMLTGENGILKQANEAKNKTEEATIEEQRKLAQIEAQLNVEGIEYNGVKIPEGYAPTRIEGENNVDKGLVIVDKEGNSYVWVEVPKNIYKTAISKEDYINIEKDMKEYAKDYRQEGYSDIWYDGCGIKSEVEYNNLKNKMLSSVYEKGGFWIAQYEVGAETYVSTDDNGARRPNIKEGLYPYDWITCIKSQELASKMTSGDVTSSLLFGIQWDLTLKYIELKGAKTQEELKVDSINWGNYFNSTFNINKGEYSTDNSRNFAKVKVEYIKQKSVRVSLITGSTLRNSALNIYDLAGNISETTLEKSLNSESTLSVARGGNYICDGNSKPSFARISINSLASFHDGGFRVTLY